MSWNHALHQEFLTGERNPRGLVESCLGRMHLLDEVLRAWVRSNPGAVTAAIASAERWSAGNPLSAIDGMPIGVKDIIDVAGLPTRAGSPLTDDTPAQSDAPAVARLRAAGAVILGKTVTTEFACFDPAPTLNPSHPELTPGGSSSGSAAAVAAGMCWGALGTQTGGSIIRPAAYCGVIGFKPAFGQVPMDGVFPVSRSLDHLGPLARTLPTAEALWRVLRGEPAPPVEPPLIPKHPPTALLSLTGWFREQTAPEMRAVYDAALARFRAAGGVIQEVQPPSDLPAMLKAHFTLMAREAAEVHRERFAQHAERYGPNVAELIRQGLSMPEEAYRTALERQRLERRQWNDWLGAGLLVLPATPAPPPLRGLATTGDPRFNSPWSLLGFPELTLPAGRDAEGLSCGVQFVCAPGNEESLWSMARWFAEHCSTYPAPPVGN